jgi:hypothetical protein
MGKKREIKMGNNLLSIILNLLSQNGFRYSLEEGEIRFHHKRYDMINDIDIESGEGDGIKLVNR